MQEHNEEDIIAQTGKRLHTDKKLHAAGTLLHNIRLLFRMLRDGNFKMELASRALIMGGLIYFLLPLDATPDYIPILGYVDDTVIIGVIIKRLSSEIDRYRRFVHS